MKTGARMPRRGTVCQRVDVVSLLVPDDVVSLDVPLEVEGRRCCCDVVPGRWVPFVLPLPCFHDRDITAQVPATLRGSPM